MKKILYILLLFSFFCSASSFQWQAENEEEALFLNRIADFWEEGEYKIAKDQMQEFLCAYPKSAFADLLCASLGDLFLREKNYKAALEYYAQIKEPTFAERVFLNRMQALYSMQWYAILADECEAHLSKNSIEPSEKTQATYYLAIALYQQCLNAQKEPEILEKLARRAQPFFETLLEDPLQPDVAAAFAHLCCILKDFPRASSIYLDLAKQNNDDEMLFQAALIQAEYDKELAAASFKEISQKGNKQAAFNYLVLLFDLQKYETILEIREEILNQVPIDKIYLTHLFFARSLFHLERFSEACAAFLPYIENAPQEETLHAALLSLLDASFRTQDLASLDVALAKMTTFYPNDLELQKGKFSRALLLKKEGNFLEAKKTLQTIVPDESLKPLVLSEWIFLDFQEKNFTTAQEKALAFLTTIPNHDLRPHIELILAKTYFELKAYEKAIPLLQNLKPTQETSLLLAFCYRDGLHDLPNFCRFAEEALETESSPDLHISLYNAYLELSLIKQASEHLFAAFTKNASIQTENLLWLSQQCSQEKAVSIFEYIVKNLPIEPLTEPAWLHLSEIYSSQNKNSQALDLLKTLQNAHQTHSSLNWKNKKDTTLLLAETYVKLGSHDLALQLFDAISKEKISLRTRIGASACLQSARLRVGSADKIQILTQLKSLVLQKTLANEPLHLEAALDYIDLQESIEKKLAKLLKIKKDFLSESDLLSKDYHEARKHMPLQDLTFQSYMQFFEAEIFLAQSLLTQDEILQKELQAKAKDLFLKIAAGNVHPALVARVKNKCLD